MGASTDFIGVQNYTRKLVQGDEILSVPKDSIKTDMGNEFYPRSLANVCRRISETWQKDILITENGISTSNDYLRQEHIEIVMKDLNKLLKEGSHITGYLHWSLLDNFEWQLGYDQKFGLIEVNRRTMERIPKESLFLLGKLGRQLEKYIEE